MNYPDVLYYSYPSPGGRGRNERPIGLIMRALICRLKKEDFERRFLEEDYWKKIFEGRF